MNQHKRNSPIWLTDSRVEVLILLLLCISAYFAFFYRLDSLPLWPWDEARNANNSIEMFYRGWSIVTYYDGEPDLWNTKPPLLNWAHQVFFDLLGPTLLSLRLPSALAGLGTTIVIYIFCIKSLHNKVVAAYSSLILMSTWGFVGEHAARMGNYDSLLVLFTSCYLLFFCAYCHAPSLNRLYFALFSCFAVLAFMTKTVQGLIFLPALIMYLAYNRRLHIALKDPLVWLCIVISLATIIGFYLLRELESPGYLAATIHNNITGRVSGTLYEGDWTAPTMYYLRRLIQNAPWIFLLPAALVFISKRETKSAFKRLYIYLISCSTFYFLIINIAQVKLTWYLNPLYPPLAIIFGLGLYEFQNLIIELKYSDSTKRVAFLTISLLIALYAASSNLAHINRTHDVASSLNKHTLYGPFIMKLQQERPDVGSYVLIKEGVSEFSNFGEDYIPSALFYKQILQESGVKIEHQIPGNLDNLHGKMVVYCGDEIADLVQASYRLSSILESEYCSASLAYLK